MTYFIDCKKNFFTKCGAMLFILIKVKLFIMTFNKT